MSEETQKEGNKPMSEEERAALCQKLDQELDDFINSLEKKRYTEGWPEERWEEEMDKHPFFMKSTPKNGDISPLVEGLAKLKYDPEENTSLELATNYKEDGNFNFKHNNYRLAILGYTEGIKQKCDSADINASLYNNRAAAQWHLKNFRSSLYDSEKALTFNPNHTKARFRAAKCALQIAKYDMCIEHCEKLLEEAKDKEVIELLRTAKKEKAVQERDQRKKERLDTEKKEQKECVIKAIIERGIRISNCDDEDDLDLAKLEPSMPGAHDALVHIEDGILKWPVLFFYPEYKMTDFVKACPENVPLSTQLEQLFPAPWDVKDEYSIDTVNIYTEGFERLPHLVDPTMNLGDIMELDYFEVKGGTPAFCVVPRGSRVEASFLASYI